MSKGKPLGFCQSCHSEIIASSNDGVFGGEEYASCEEHRYETHATLLESLVEIRNATESLDYDDWDVLSELKAKTEAFDHIRELAYAAIRLGRLSTSPNDLHD